MEGSEFEFAEIVARNFPEEIIINHITIAYIPGVGRLDLMIIPEGEEYYG